MKTNSYNPSPLELEFAETIANLTKELSEGLTTNKVVETSTKSGDNPTVFIRTVDDDGDPHEIVLKVIQRPDKF